MFLLERSICLVTAWATHVVFFVEKPERNRGHHWTILDQIGPLDLVLKANIYPLVMST